MRRTRLRSKEIVLKLQKVEILMGRGMSRLDAVSQIGVIERTYYRWRKQ